MAAPVTLDTRRAVGGRGEMPERLASSSSWICVHPSRMKREIEIERAAPKIAAARLAGEPFDFRARTRNRDRMRGVERRDLGGAAEFGEKGARGITVERQRRHPPGALRSLLAATAGNDDASGIRQ